MLSFLIRCFNKVIDLLFGLYFDRKGPRVEPPPSRLVLQSATSLATKIRNGGLSAEEVVRAYISRINQINHTINAVVDHCYTQAIEEAQRIDQRLSTGKMSKKELEEKPLLGVPFTAKECIASKGLSNTLGLRSRLCQKADFDAEVIQLLKKAGAIIIGVSNIPQVSAWYETRNPIYGLSRNPYDAYRTVGGSSGGEGSIVAACGSAFGIGSDLGGSVRNPALMCGLFGHKPTQDIVSLDGLMFNRGKKVNSMATVGPLVRHSEDLIPILKVISAENAKLLKLDAEVDIKRLKVYYVKDPKDPLLALKKEMTEVIVKAVDHFASLGNDIELVNIKELKYGGILWWYWIGREPNVDVTQDLANRQGTINPLTEILKFLFGFSDFNFEVILLLLGSLFPKKKSQWAEAMTTNLKEKLLDLLGTDGVLLYPSAPEPAPYHYTSLFRPFNANLFSMWNALKFCATQVPMGLNKDGLPVGLQVVGPPFQDRLTVAVARELEREFGGYVPPFDENLSCDNE